MMSVVQGVTDEELHAYFDGELSSERRAYVHAWLEGQPGATDRINVWRHQTEAIRDLFEPVMAEPLPNRFASLMHDRAERRRPAWGSLLLGAAAVLVIFSAGFASGLHWPEAVVRTGRSSNLAGYGLSAHAVYVTEVRHPVEVAAAEEDHLVKWLSKRLGAPLVVPNLIADGLSLIGGRLLPAEGKPGAMLMYEAASGDRFSLLVTHGSENADTAFRYERSGGFGSFYWYSGDFGYVLVGPADKARLFHISRKVYDELS